MTPGTAERIQALRLKSGRTEQELAGELGLTINSYSDLEQHDEELESAISIAQALKLANLLHTDLLTLLGETEIPVRMPIARVRSALNAQLGKSAEARELMEDTLNWDLGPFLEGLNEWTTVYTIDFVRQLATAIEVDWQVLLAGIADA
ncbi:MAG TPA: helix-turn-helix transcriptional regulator [Steroidobacteraceae bacterium]|jgi:transcriptional regulator with XRE-family HTH domain|nr:helix-turn-helix transcriptional regulator [Steroidobacteraceae bacterium]